MYQVISAEYAQNMVVCLPQDLRTFYAYWDFTGLRNQVVQDFLERVKPDCRLVVRLCRLEPGKPYFVPEQTVNLTQITTGNYYFRNLNPADTYCCEIGAITPDGGFICFYQTEPLQMQPKLENNLVDAFDWEAFPEDHDQPEVTGNRLANEQQLLALSSWN